MDSFREVLDRVEVELPPLPSNREALSELRGKYERVLVNMRRVMFFRRGLTPLPILDPGAMADVLKYSPKVGAAAVLAKVRGEVDSGLKVLLEEIEAVRDRIDRAIEAGQEQEQVTATEASGGTGSDNPKGVTLYDVAFAVEQDEEAASVSRKKWSDSGKIKARPIGKCPLDGRRDLLQLEEVLRDVAAILSFSKAEESKYRQALIAKLRAPAHS